MIEERALVLAHESGCDPRVTVKTQRLSACQSCQLKSACGQSALAKISGEKSIELVVDNTFDAVPGDVVVIGIPEQGLLKASALMFLMPLLAMVSLASIAQGVLNLSELYVAIVGSAGLVSGFLFARHLAAKWQDSPDFKPVMLGVALKTNAAALCATSEAAVFTPS